MIGAKMNGVRHSQNSARRAGGLAAFTRSLRSDTSGNTLAMAATSLLILLAAVGGAVDMSRAYLAKTNMQAACDAGVLAGRRALSKATSYTDTEKAVAAKMFNFNLRAKQSQLTDIEFETEAHTTGSVSGKATSQMPTAIMYMFGFPKFDLSVECSAELQMASADVMFVLDTTGSMNESLSGGGTKIEGLRSAIAKFHETVANAVIDKNKTIIRYGFVPYSLTVNAGGLVSSGAMPTSWFRNTNNYPSRIAIFDLPYDLAVPKPSTTKVTDETYSSNITSANCTNYGKNTYPTGSGGTPINAGTKPSPTTVTSYVLKSWTYKSTSNKVQYGECIRTKTVVTTTYDIVKVMGYNGNYTVAATPIDTTGGNGGVTILDVSKLLKPVSSTPTVPRNYVPVPTGVDPNTPLQYNGSQLYKMRGAANTALPADTTANNKTAAWSGCIEERDTVVDEDMKPIPDGAYDLDINNAPDPDDDATKWRYYLPGLFSSVPSGDSATCPAPMLQFQEVSTKSTALPDDIKAYVNKQLVPAGTTFHDIGMVWGARLASTRGMFSANVLAKDSNGKDRKSVSRHIIFMTDGVINPDVNSYSAWGMEKWEWRTVPAGTTTEQAKPYHTNRFLAACQLARDEGYTIWVIGFGTKLTDDMKGCSSAGRAYQANNNQELLNAFKYIAGQVADLRINK